MNKPYQDKNVLSKCSYAADVTLPTPYLVAFYINV